jgi:hypothetical protein
MLSEQEYQEIQYQLEQIPTPTENKQQTNLRKRLKKQLKEHEYVTECRPFDPLPHIQYFINRITTKECLYQLIQAATVSLEFTIDTESINIYRERNDPVLMQLQIFLPHNSSFILLIEMYHLPDQNDARFKLIQHLFRIVFSQNKQIYIWGPRNELYPFDKFKLFSREQSNNLHIINLQKQFKIFWKQHHPHHSSKSNSSNISTTNCDCENCLGIGSSNLWSLQNAVRFELNEYLSKQFSQEDFHIGLDPELYQLNLDEKRYRQQLTTYASNDCSSMQRLIIQMKNKKFKFQFESNQNIQYDISELSPISSDDDDTNLFTQLSNRIPKPKINLLINNDSNQDDSSNLKFKLFTPSIEIPENDIQSSLTQEESDMNHPPEQPMSLFNSTRTSNYYGWENISSNDDDDSTFTNTNKKSRTSTSTSRTSTRFPTVPEELSQAERKKIHNRSSTLRQRKRCYQHEIIRRNIDGRFTYTQVKNILRQHHIPFNLVNITRSKVTEKYSLYIGIRDPLNLRTYTNKTRYLFTVQHYKELHSHRRRQN